MAWNSLAVFFLFSGLQRDCPVPDSPGSAVLYLNSRSFSLKEPVMVVIEVSNEGSKPVRIADHPRFERKPLDKNSVPMDEKRTVDSGKSIWNIVLECWTTGLDTEYGDIDRRPFKESLIKSRESFLKKFCIPAAYLSKGRCKIRVRIERNGNALFYSQPIWIKCSN